MIKSEIKSENALTSIPIEKVDKDRDVCLVPKNINDESLTYSDGETTKRTETELIPILKTDTQNTKQKLKVAFPQAVIEKDENMETEENLKSQNTKPTELAMENLNMIDSGEAADSDAETYIIDVILEHKPKNAKEHSKAKKYKIKWEGYPDPSEHTWEPVESIMDTAELVVVEYWKKLDEVREAERLAKLKKKSDMKLTGAKKRARFGVEIIGPTDSQIEGLQAKVNHFEKITNNWGPMSRHGSCMQTFYDNIHLQINILLRSPFFIDLNEKLTAENNSNSIKLKKFIEDAKNGIPSKNHMAFMKAIYKVLKENQRVLPLRDFISELKMYLVNQSLMMCTDNE